MKLIDVFKILRTTTLPSVSNLKQLSDEELLRFVNEVILSLHNRFIIRVEQAIILVPKFRDTFKIRSEDQNVIMGTYYKFAHLDLNSPNETKNEILKNIPYKEVNQDDLINHLVGKDSLNANTRGAYPQPQVLPEYCKKMFENSKTKCLQILSVKDKNGNELIINEDKCIMVDPITLYFPYAKEGDVYYVEYKPYPDLIDYSQTKTYDDVECNKQTTPDPTNPKIYKTYMVDPLVILPNGESLFNFADNIHKAYLNSYDEATQRVKQLNEEPKPPGEEDAIYVLDDSVEYFYNTYLKEPTDYNLYRLLSDNDYKIFKRNGFNLWFPVVGIDQNSTEEEIYTAYNATDLSIYLDNILSQFNPNGLDVFNEFGWNWEYIAALYKARTLEGILNGN